MSEFKFYEVIQHLMHHFYFHKILSRSLGSGWVLYPPLQIPSECLWWVKRWNYQGDGTRFCPGGALQLGRRGRLVTRGVSSVLPRCHSRRVSVWHKLWVVGPVITCLLSIHFSFSPLGSTVLIYQTQKEWIPSNSMQVIRIINYYLLNGLYSFTLVHWSTNRMWN